MAVTGMSPTAYELSEEEQAIVEVVREFVDQQVKPVVRELEHSNTYPEQLIEQMKQLGIFGLAIPEPYGEVHVSTPCYALVTEELARGWMSLAGAMGGHTVVAKLLLAFGTEEQRGITCPGWPPGSCGRRSIRTGVPALIIRAASARARAGTRTAAASSPPPGGHAASQPSSRTAIRYRSVAASVIVSLASSRLTAVSRGSVSSLLAAGVTCPIARPSAPPSAVPASRDSRGSSG